MNHFFLSPKQRLNHWKEFRDSLSSLSETDQLEAVAKYWGLAPLKSIACDPERLNLCLTPWEMIANNDWCKYSVAVGMEFTLRLSGWDKNRILIKMIKDYDISDQKLVVEIDEKYFLNYDYGMFITIPNTNFLTLNTWLFDDKNYTSKLN